MTMAETGRTETTKAASASGLIAGKGALHWAEEGIRCTEHGDLLGALHSLQRSLECDSNCYEAWVGLAEVFMVMKDLERADRCLEVARRIRAQIATPRIATA